MPLINHNGKVLSSVPPHVQRMLEESNQLGQRLLALDDFTNTNVFKALPELDQQLLLSQGAPMQAYLRILTLRIQRAAPQPPATTGELDRVVE